MIGGYGVGPLSGGARAPENAFCTMHGDSKLLQNHTTRGVPDDFAGRVMCAVFYRLKTSIVPQVQLYTARFL